VRLIALAVLAMWISIAESRADYPPYRYAPSAQGRVLLVNRDSGAGQCNDCKHGHCALFGHGHHLFGHHQKQTCSSGSSGSGGTRMEYAPYRYQPVYGAMPPPPGLAGQVGNGSLREYQFMDLQPRTVYPPSPYPTPTPSQ